MLIWQGGVSDRDSRGAVPSPAWLIGAAGGGSSTPGGSGVRGRFHKGDYSERQRRANADQAIAYVEHHFNSSSSPAAEYTVVITGSNASQTSRNWGRWYAQAISREFEVPDGGDAGIMVGGYSGRGDGNLRHTAMPAILLEPLFASNPRHAEIVRSEDGQMPMARVLVDSIKRFFPDGGLIAFSVGHKYKTSNPNDRGAALVGGAPRRSLRKRCC